MPWSSNNNNGGGWKSGGNGGGGGGGPWGQGGGSGGGGGGGGGGQQPDLEEMLKRSQDRLRKTMGGGSGLPGPLMLLIAAVGIAVMAYYAFTVKINTDELGVVLRFGKFDRTMGAGLNYKLPYPIEQVLKPKITRQNRIPVGFRLTGGRNYSAGITDVPAESLMLTGDENIVDIDFEVFWRIANTKDSSAKDYLFNIQNPVVTVKEVAESAMREVIGTKNIQLILTKQRGPIQEEVQTLMQTTLDTYGSGVEITQIVLQKVDPPKQVIDAFKDVQSAQNDQKRLQEEANAYKNRVIAEAKGKADRITAAAAAYKAQSIADANGEAQRFTLIYDQYKVAKDVTRKRMFLETMERVFRGTDKIILDSGGGGVVPYLPLNELAKGKPKAGGR